MLHTDLQIASSTLGMLSTAMLFVAGAHVHGCDMDEDQLRAMRVRRRRFNVVGISALFLSFAGSLASALL